MSATGIVLTTEWVSARKTIHDISPKDKAMASLATSLICFIRLICSLSYGLISTSITYIFKHNSRIYSFNAWGWYEIMTIVLRLQCTPCYFGKSYYLLLNCNELNSSINSFYSFYVMKPYNYHISANFKVRHRASHKLIG